MFVPSTQPGGGIAATLDLQEEMAFIRITRTLHVQESGQEGVALYSYDKQS